MSTQLPPQLSQLGRTITKHAMFFGLVLGILFDGWIAWQTLEQWTDQPLPADQITAQQLRVNESQRQTVSKNLTSYRQPSTIPTLPGGLF